MTSQPGQQTIAMHILPNISRSKGNQTINQAIEKNMKAIFLEKPYIKYGGETSPRPFSGKLKLSISLDQQAKDFYSLFLLNPKLRAIEIY